MPYLNLQNRRIEFAWYMPASPSIGNPVVLLHEGLGSVALWKEFPQRLAESTGHAVCAYSRYGYGQSDPLLEKRDPEYMHDEALRSLPELLGKLGIRNPILMGHSDGASIALIYAGAQAQPVESLILMAPHVFVEDIGLDSIRQTREGYLNSDLRTRLAKRHADPDSAFWGWNDIWLDPRFRTWNIEWCLPRIQCPILVVQGQQDTYGTMEQVHHIVRGADRVEVCKLDDCGHSPHRDQPESVLARVRAFLRDNTPDQPAAVKRDNPPI